MKNNACNWKIVGFQYLGGKNEMRLHLYLTPNRETVGFDYPHRLTGAFHRLMGENDVHENISLYSLGWLEGQSQLVQGGLTFPAGARWALSFHETALAERFFAGIARDDKVAYGMRIYKWEEQPTPVFGGMYRFEVGSPVVVRKPKENGRRQHLIYSDTDADAFLTHTLRSKLKAAGFTGEHLNTMIGFDRSYKRAHTKLVEIKGIRFRGSLCPVIVVGTSEAVQFAWNTGAGHLTGSAFGFLK